ncbi:isochorismate synthase (plasmid) [Deinococcus taeanensis]|uniref:isochorismate synthase n=1 Tax=Deinococcus taeanensis TaxID=2737050 RepID=UPI001CDCB1A9|nr:isochorismate synthase [Deinococcus taeanensis]UBV45048.1 isochorismate synthase [Deinococcus taeanensis]
MTLTLPVAPLTPSTPAVPAWHSPSLTLHLTHPHAPPLTSPADLLTWQHGAAPHEHLVGAVGFGPDSPLCFHPAAPVHPAADLPLPPAIPRHVLAARTSPAPRTFEANVAQATAAIRSGALHKVVLARTLHLTLDPAPDVRHVSAHLHALAPDAFVFALPLERGGATWLVGASPELLLRKRGRHLTLRPLAGTRPRHPDPALDLRRGHDLLRSAKDRHEHALMVDDLRRTLTPLCRDLTVPETPQLVQTAGLWHLATSIQAELRDPRLHVLDVVQAVHPTPAVCGVPQAAAHALIRELEPARGLFAGAVGWCDGAGNGEWAVTIRCAQLRGPQAHLFAGAGVVADSSPAAERAETAAKFGVMLRALGVNPAALDGTL